MNRALGLVVGLQLAVLPVLPAQISGPSTGGAAALAQAERMLGHTKRVLMIAAHPDDEDTELLTYLVRREGAITGYLSLTRGEGGQNLIGPELGDALGLIRTEELLAARGLDGARQYFTRAFDFGFTKTLAEALTFWPRDSILKDVVRVVRRTRPQILVSVFSGTPRDGHGQHQAAGWVAREAFAAAGDSTRFPELGREEGLTPWQPLKLYRSAWFDTTRVDLTLEGGRLDPEVGQSYRQIAMRGRSFHRSQDMGVLQEIGPSPIRLALEIDRTGRGSNLFAGIDTAPPLPGTAEARDLIGYRDQAAAIRAGLVFDAIADRSRLVAGEPVAVRLSAWNAGAAAVPVRIDLDLPADWRVEGDCLGREVTVGAGATAHCSVRVRPPEGAVPTTPYFLAEARQGAWYRWTGSPTAWGEPFAPPLLLGRFAYQVGTDRHQAIREVQHRIRDQAIGEVRRPLAVVPRVSVDLGPPARLWPVGGRREQTVTVTLQHAGRDSTLGVVSLELPAGWRPVPSQPFRLTRPDEKRSFEFTVAAPAGIAPGEYRVRAVAKDAAGHRYEQAVVSVNYPHIRERGYTVASSISLRVAKVAIPAGRRIGYVRGAADRVPEALAGVGIEVELLDGKALESADLKRFAVIVIGSRAYETEPALAENNDRLLDYAKGGGHLVVQYQQQAFFGGQFAPFPLTVGAPHDRVTDETAPVRVLTPDDPLFRTPNVIGAGDWEGWVQERGLYFARTWDSRYQPLLETNDPGAQGLKGGLLAARLGAGTYVYTGLAFFRQLPAGVPGAFRLFANLLAAGARAAQP